MPSRNGSTPYLECRTLRHAWDPTSTKVGYTLSLLCVRCTTERHDEASQATGELFRRRYIYPKGYRMAASDTPGMEDLRVELMRKIRSGNATHLRRR